MIEILTAAVAAFIVGFAIGRAERAWKRANAITLRPVKPWPAAEAPPYSPLVCNAHPCRCSKRDDVCECDPCGAPHTAASTHNPDFLQPHCATCSAPLVDVDALAASGEADEDDAPDDDGKVIACAGCRQGKTDPADHAPWCQDAIARQDNDDDPGDLDVADYQRRRGTFVAITQHEPPSMRADDDSDSDDGDSEKEAGR